MSLIEELYSPEEGDRIKALYEDGGESKKHLLEALGIKILDSDKVLTSSPLDILYIICSLAKFADSEEECQSVAIIINTRIKDKNPLPYILDDRGIVLAEKTLVSLSFFSAAMNYRSAKKGAPKPSFYRECSKKIFVNNNHHDIADHHEQWEGFLSEMFLC